MIKNAPAALDLVIQREAAAAENAPSDAQFQTWVTAALHGAERQGGELTIRVVDADESRALNRDYRSKDKPTNVLSFGYDVPAREVGAVPDVFGDLVICAPVVEREAREQGKPIDIHWAHMTVHGCLHLCGYDHEDDGDAAQMETLEIAVLAGLGLPDPYAA